MLPFELTKKTPYLALSGELWSVFYEYFNRNWLCYKGFLLYLTHCSYVFFLHQAINTWFRAFRAQSYTHKKPHGKAGIFLSVFSILLFIFSIIFIFCYFCFTNNECHNDWNYKLILQLHLIACNVSNVIFQFLSQKHIKQCDYVIRSRVIFFSSCVAVWSGAVCKAWTHGTVPTVASCLAGGVHVPRGESRITRCWQETAERADWCAEQGDAYDTWSQAARWSQRHYGAASRAATRPWLGPTLAARGPGRG